MDEHEEMVFVVQDKDMVFVLRKKGVASRSGYMSSVFCENY